MARLVTAQAAWATKEPPSRPFLLAPPDVLAFKCKKIPAYPSRDEKTLILEHLDTN
jgi:hypothetical protein